MATFQPKQGGGVQIKVKNGGGSMRTGLRVSNTVSNDTTAYGINVSVPGTTTKFVYGTKSLCGQGLYGSYGVMGGITGISSSLYTTKSAGIYGSASSLWTFKYPGNYAGYFNGDVRVTGTIYGTLLTPSESSTSAVAEVAKMASVYDDEQTTVSDKLKQVQLLQFYREKEHESSAKAISVITDMESLDMDEEQDELISSDAYTPQTDLSTVKYGLAADQLKDVYPELVYEDNEGNLSINYIEMIPLLVQSINELNSKILELEQNSSRGVAYQAKSRTDVTNIEEVKEDDAILLAQNVPNPFNERTTIDVIIPETVRTASLFIYDMNGKQVKQINISERGEYKINITSEGLEAGMYLYSLITDGKIINTKRMILTK